MVSQIDFATIIVEKLTKVIKSSALEADGKICEVVRNRILPGFAP